MNNTLKEIFGQIRADEELKNHTRAFLAHKTHGYTKSGRHTYHVLAAVCACLFFLLTGGHWLYFTPTANICIDINPSIELGVNRFDQVISVNGLNEDGRELSASLDITFKNYTDAVEQIFNNKTMTVLLSRHEVMTITVTGSDQTQSAKILSQMEACTAGCKNARCFSASQEEVAAAHSMGLSHGKYRAFLEPQSLYPDITPEEIQGMSMREIRDLMDAALSENEEEARQEQGGRHGHHGWRHGKNRRDSR